MKTFYAKCGTPFYVDDDCSNLVGSFTWYIDKDGYISRKTTINGVKGTQVILHRIIMDAKKGQIVDHIDHNKTNNVRENLRLADRSSNGCNRLKQSNCSSRFIGVTWVQREKKWASQIGINKKRIHIGLFDSEHIAAHEYNKAAIRLHGEFCTLNPIGFPDEHDYRTTHHD